MTQASTPHDASSAIRSRRSTVQAMTRRPAAWAAATAAPVSEPSAGASAVVAPSGDRGQRLHRVVAGDCQPPRRQRRRGGLDGVDRRQVEAGDDRLLGHTGSRHRGRDLGGELGARVEAGIQEAVLELDVDQAQPGARGQGAVERGQPVGERRSGQRGDRPVAGHHRVVVHDQHPVGSAADVELDAIGAEAAGQGERLEGVLADTRALGLVCPPVGDDQHGDRTAPPGRPGPGAGGPDAPRSPIGRVGQNFCLLRSRPPFTLRKHGVRQAKTPAAPLVNKCTSLATPSPRRPPPPWRRS